MGGWKSGWGKDEMGGGRQWLEGGGTNGSVQSRTIIIESVDSISRDDPNTPYNIYIIKT